MKIGVLSDTHVWGRNLSPKQLMGRLIHQVNEDAARLCAMLRPHFAGVDLIIHAGDFVSRDVITALEEFAPVEGVAGNSDPADIVSLLPAKTVVNADGVKIGLMHGYGPARDLEKRVRREFVGVDCIVFGHSHSPFSAKVEGVLMFNPGSPTDRRFAPTHSIGILEIEGGKIRPRLVPI